MRGRALGAESVSLDHGEFVSQKARLQRCEALLTLLKPLTSPPALLWAQGCLPSLARGPASLPPALQDAPVPPRPSALVVVLPGVCRHVGSAPTTEGHSAPAWREGGGGRGWRRGCWKAQSPGSGRCCINTHPALPGQDNSEASVCATSQRSLRDSALVDAA